MHIFGHIVRMMFLRFLFYELIYSEIDVFTFFILGLIKFSPYKYSQFCF